MRDKQKVPVVEWRNKYPAMTRDQEIQVIHAWLVGEVDHASAEGRQARRAVARMLFEKDLPQELQYMLACRIDSDLSELVGHRLVLEPTPRPRGRPKVQSWEVAEIVERRIRCGDKKEAAYQFAVEKLGVSKRTAEKAHAECKEQLRALAPYAKIITRLD
jgi:hypothetical protein